MERVVGADHDLGAVLEPGGALDLDPRRERVGDEDARDAAVDHDLRLGDLGAGDADRPEVHLAAGDPRRLVALGVGTPVLAAGRDGGRQPVRRCASNRPRSSRSDGVSSSAFGRPMAWIGGRRRRWSWPRVSLTVDRDGAGTVRPGERHCRLSTIAAHGDRDGGRRLGRVLGRADGAGQRALRLVHVGRRARRRHGPRDLPARHGSRRAPTGTSGSSPRPTAVTTWELRFLGLPRTGLGRLAGRDARLVLDGAGTGRADRLRAVDGPVRPEPPVGPPGDPGPARDAQLPDPLDRRRTVVAGPPADRPRRRTRARRSPARSCGWPTGRSPSRSRTGRSTRTRRRASRAPGCGCRTTTARPGPRTSSSPHHPDNAIYYWDQRLATHPDDGRLVNMFWTHVPADGRDIDVHIAWGTPGRPDLDRAGRDRAARPALPADLARGRPAAGRLLASDRARRASTRR